MTMRLVAVEMHDFQVNYAAWLGEGDVEKGIQRALNYVNDTCYNHPT